VRFERWAVWLVSVYVPGTRRLDNGESRVKYVNGAAELQVAKVGRVGVNGVVR
jgi:hypothetical protein